MDMPALAPSLAFGGTTAKFNEALDQGRFVLFAQKIEAVPHGAHASCQEIFVRFMEEEEKLLPPGTFLSVLDDYRLMRVLDRWIVSRVLAWLQAQLAGSSLGPPRCSVNLSNDALDDEAFGLFVVEELHARAVPGDFLLLELREQDIARARTAFERLAAALRPAGCGFVVTDYRGTLLSAEALSRLGVDFVKIDSDLSARMDEEPARLARTRTINDTCRRAGLKTIGERIEHRTILERFQDIGVDFVQGFLIGMPEPLR